MIKLTLIGNLGKDAVSNSVSGKTVINFNVAHTEKYKDAQGNAKEKTTWVDCSWWSEKTAILPYLKKGTSLYVEGQPDVRSYITKEGVHGSTLTLRVNMVHLLGSRSQENNNGSVSDTPPSNGGDIVDDLPF